MGHVLIAWYPTVRLPAMKLQSEATISKLAANRLGVLREVYIRTWGKAELVPQVSWLHEPIADNRAQPFVAIVDEKLVGCVVPVIKPDTGEGVLSKGVHVLPAFQRRRIGTSLLMIALEWFREMAVDKAWVWPWNPNGAAETAAAERFYLANGGTIIEDTKQKVP